MKIGDLQKKYVLSLAARMSHLADYIAMFRRVFHSTTIGTTLPFSAQGEGYRKISFYRAISLTFHLPCLDVNCIISHVATIS